MNDPHRSDRSWQSLATTGLAASVPAQQGRNERKGLPKDWIGASLVLFCSFATVGVITGCNTSHANATPQTPLISVAITQAPPTPMITGNSAIVSAAVANDPAAAGVDWVVTCASAGGSGSPCGTFTPSHTASGATAIYTAPPAIPSKNAVLVTALSTTDRSKSSTATISLVSTLTGIAITTPLPGVVPAGSVLTFGATVYGDPANLGADWTVTCSTPDAPVVCGSGLHSTAGGTIPFTVPQTVTDPVINQQVSVVGTAITITAFATADHSVWATYGPLPVTAPISISITQQPPATMLTGATAQVIAVVANDTSNAGVGWLVTCSLSTGPCGSIPPTLNVTATVNIVAPVSVSIAQGVTNNTIVANRTASLVATVSNDLSNAGVDWTVSCGSPGACGAFSPAHTASEAATTYTAPSAPPSGNTVTITATSTADPTKSAQQPNITVVSAPPPNSLLNGQFVLFLNARNSQNGPFMFGGVVSGNGNGTITGGSFDEADATGNFAASSS